MGYDKKDLKRIKKLEQDLANCKKQLEDANKEIENLKNENRQLKESVNNQARINDTKLHNVNGAGRKPKSEEKMREQLQQIESSLSNGMKEKDIYTSMGISRSTYYRIKKYGKQECH